MTIGCPPVIHAVASASAVLPVNFVPAWLCSGSGGDEETMIWVIIAVLILGIGAYFGNEYRLDRKAHKLNSSSEEDRRLAAELQDIARKIDEGKYLYR